MTWRWRPSRSWRCASSDGWLAAGLPIRWAAFDEVYARSGKLREACEKAGLAYVAIIPCDYPVTTAGRHRDPRGPGGHGRGVRAALVRHRDQGTPAGGLGADRHRQPAAFPADPPPDLPPGPARPSTCATHRRAGRRP